MASGEIFGLAVPVLASIYRGLNTIFNNPVPRKSSNGFAIHYVYAWIAHFFKSHHVVNDELGKPMMTRYFGVSYEAPFDKASTRDRIQSGKDFFWHGTSFRSDLDLTFEENGGLSVPRLGYFMSLHSRYLSLQCEDHCVVESYSPHRFSRRFGFYQNILGDLKKRIQTGTLKELYQYYQSFTHSNTSSIVLIPSSSTNFEKRVTGSYTDWWKKFARMTLLMVLIH